MYCTLCGMGMGMEMEMREGGGKREEGKQEITGRQRSVALVLI